MKRLNALLGFSLFVLSLGVQQLAAQPASKQVINHFVSDPKQNTVLYVTDFDGTAPDVTITFYDEGGNIIGQKKMKLPEGGTVPVKPNDVVKRQTVGNIRIESGGSSVVAEYWQVVEEDDFSYSVAVPSHPAKGSKKLIVQHFVSDPDVWSVIYLTNPQDRAADVSLEFHDADGNLIGSITKKIESNGTLTLKPLDVINRKVFGNVHITSDAPLTGEYWQKVNTEVEGKEVKYVVAVPLQSLGGF